MPEIEGQEGRPYPNEHAARLVDPDGFERFRRVNDAGGPGVDFIYGIKGNDPIVIQAIRFDAARFTPAEARKWLDLTLDPTAILFEEATGEQPRDLTPDMTVAQGMLYEALEDITGELGQFAQADAHYMPESPFADQGMVCSNCAFYQGPAACEVVQGEIAPSALCKFWIIPASKLTTEPAAPRALVGAELQTRLKGQTSLTREMTVNVAEASDGMARFTFSSEAPVERWFGTEVLSHADGAADLSRLNNGAPFLWNHDRDVVLGVHESAAMDGKNGHATIRWARNSQAMEKRQDYEDGILRKISFAYEIREAVPIGENGILVTKWQPLETSLVSIPADDSVGPLRMEAPPEQPVAPVVITPPQAEREAPEAVAIVEEQIPVLAETMTVETPTEARSAADERERVLSIQALCKQHDMPEGMASDLITAEASIDAARAAVLDKVGARGRELQPGGLHVEADALIGMDQRDLKRYSVVNLLRYLADPTSQSARDAAGFELECSREAERKYERSANGALIPFDWMAAKRDQTVGNFGKGGALVGTELLAGSFIDLLRNQSALLQAGVTQINGLTGNVDFPRKTAASQHYWVGEDQDVTTSDATFGLISSTPKTIGVRVPVSRRALIQTTPDIDTLVRNDMAGSLALGYDAAGLYGSGSSGQPLGLRNVTGIGSVTFGGGSTQTYPAALGGGSHDSGDWTDYIQILGSCLAANVTPDSFRYIMNATTMVGGMVTLRASAAGADFIIGDNGTIGRYPVQMSNQVQTNDVFGGVFSDMILATWSGMDIVVDNLTQAAKGQVIYTVMQDVDWVCRRAASFALGS